MTRNEIESLFKTYYAQMYHLALTILFDDAESKDVVSEVFARLLSSRTVLLPDTAGRYLMTSVRNSCQSVLAHRLVRERFFRMLTANSAQTGSYSPPDEQLQMQELMRYVETNLSPQELQVFRLRYLREMTCREVADEIGISRQTVHVRLQQAIEKIRVYFKSNSQSR
ncbi:MAG: sigma-70 family RNA polymerase sigma factor [Prevotella sp.]|nr:sigma-70 family RNA polymerase sigma factor [Prevotella sp.]